MRKAIGIALITFVIATFLNMFFQNVMPDYTWIFLGINNNLFFISWFLGAESIKKENCYE